MQIFLRRYGLVFFFFGPIALLPGVGTIGQRLIGLLFLNCLALPLALVYATAFRYARSRSQTTVSVRGDPLEAITRGGEHADASLSECRWFYGDAMFATFPRPRRGKIPQSGRALLIEMPATGAPLAPMVAVGFDDASRAEWIRILEASEATHDTTRDRPPWSLSPLVFMVFFPLALWLFFGLALLASMLVRGAMNQMGVPADLGKVTSGLVLILGSLFSICAMPILLTPRGLYTRGRAMAWRIRFGTVLFAVVLIVMVGAGLWSSDLFSLRGRIVGSAELVATTLAFSFWMQSAVKRRYAAPENSTTLDS